LQASERASRARRRRAAAASLFAAAVSASTGALAQSTWNGGTGNWADPTKWTGGVPNSPTVDVFIDGGNVANSIVTLDEPFPYTGTTIRSLTLDAGDKLVVNPILVNGPSPIGLSIVGNSTINGTIVVGSSGTQGSDAEIALGPGVVLGGNGAITNSPLTFKTVLNGPTSGASATLGTNVLLHGQALFIIDGRGAGLVNFGTIRTDSELGVDSGRLVTVANLTNRGLIDFSTATGAIHDVVNAAGGTVIGRVSGNRIINQGVFSHSGTVATLFTDFTNSAGAVFNINNSDHVELYGSFNNAGTVNINSGGLRFTGGYQTATFAPGSYTRGPGVSVALSGNGNNPTDGLLDNTGATLNAGGIAGGGDFIVGNRGTVRGGTIIAIGGRLLLGGVGGGGALDGVALNTGSAGAVVVPGPASTLLNTLTFQNNSVLDFTNASLFFSGSNGLTLGGVGSLVNNGTGVSSIAAQLGVTPAAIGPGVLIHGRSIDLFDSFVNHGTIRSDIAGGVLRVLQTGVQGFDNQGTVGAGPGSELSIAHGVFTNHATLGLDPGSTLRVTADGKLDSPGGLAVPSAVTLTGDSGVLSGNTVLSGIVSPTDDAAATLLGVLSFNGKLTFGAGSHYVATLGSNSARHDVLSVTGDLDLSAPNDSLDLSFTQTPTATTSFTIATYTGNLVGAFDNVTPGFTVDYSTPGQVIVTGVPEPSSIAFASLGAVAMLQRRRHRCRRRQRARTEAAHQDM
jgi:hypothetical protein